jgi:hypothetical protein
MKQLSLLFLILCFNLQLYGQTISGYVIDDSNGEPLIYASIGVLETIQGTITNEEGNFTLDLKYLPSTMIVRFSMIGFKARTITIDQLLNNKHDTIRLRRETYNLSEVLVRPSGKFINVGTMGYSFKNGFCGWGGNDFGKGWEIGTMIDLDNSPKRLKSLHIRVNKQSYDSSLFRLHVRDVVDSLPRNELLKTNILISITKESGWIEIDLSKYNLVFEGKISLTLEWIKVIGLDMTKLVTSKGVNNNFPAVTFNVKQKEGLTFRKWGTEAKWTYQDKISPSIYLTVQ